MDDKRDTDVKYVSVYVPDKARLAQLLAQARGEDRTMAEFAAVCGVSATTFSRITRKDIRKPLKEELLKKIADNAADPETVTLDMLRRANGMRPEDETEDSRKVSAIPMKREIAEITYIISGELFARGFMIISFPRLGAARECFKDESDIKGKLGITVPSTFCIRIKGYEPKYWNFIVDLSESWFTKRAIPKESRARAEVQAGAYFIEDHSGLFLKDAWEAETLKDIRNCFVFINEGVFNSFTELMKDKRVNSSMSAILVDLKHRRVEREIVFPRNGGETEQSIFDLAKLEYGEEE